MALLPNQLRLEQLAIRALLIEPAPPAAAGIGAAVETGRIKVAAGGKGGWLSGELQPFS
jgi:hypothetical protein